MPNETPKAGHDDELTDDIIEVHDEDLEDEVDDAAGSDAADEPEDDEADDDDEDDDAATAAGATKRKKAAKKPLTKDELRAEEKRKKRAERERIELSKQIAAEARGKKYEPKGSAKKKPTDGKPLTKEQERTAAAAQSRAAEGNPVWFKPIMFGFLLLGFIWILVYYMSSGRAPVGALGDWNILIGFGIALVGFLMMSNWK